MTERANATMALIAGFTLLRLLLAATAPLLPQEAYYWSWSRHLAPGYFDHPPLASYTIALTTAVFGSTGFGTKSAAVLWSLGWNLIWARLIVDMFGSRRLAFWSVLALNLTVVYEVLGVGPTPDGPLLFGWVGTIWAAWRACASADLKLGGRWWLAAGVFAGLAMLGKYSAVLLLPVVLLFLALSPAQRHWLRRPQPYLAVLIAALMFMPVVWWNAENQWASFAFQSSRRVGQMGGFKPRYFLLLLGTQLLMVTPYLLGIALAALVRDAREAFTKGIDERTRLLLISGAVPLLLFSLISLRSLVKINWLAPAYWSLVILAMHHLLQRGALGRRTVVGLASSAAILVAVFVVSAIPNLKIAGDLNSWSGWREAAVHVERIELERRALGERTFVFSPNYKISSLLRFYLPGQPRTYAQDIYGDPALQYDYFALDSDLKGASGILVTSDQDQGRVAVQRIAPYFESLEHVDTIETRAFGRVTRRVDLWLGRNYRGHPRLDPLHVPDRRQPQPD